MPAASPSTAPDRAQPLGTAARARTPRATAVSQIARHFAGSFLTKAREPQQESSKGKKRNNRNENIKEIMTVIRSLNGKGNLHTKLVKTRATIIWKDSSRPLVSPSDLDDVPDMDEIDRIHSYVATLFQLMRHYPKRFRTFDANPDKPEEYIWGYHQEDWFRAHVALQRLLQRRREDDNISSKDTTRPVKDWPGYISSAVDLDNAGEPSNQRSAFLEALRFESEVLGGTWDDDTGGGGDRLATRDEIRAALGDAAAGLCTYHSDGTLKNDDLGRLSDLITRGMTRRFELDNPSTDPMAEAEANRLKDGTPAPTYPTKEELDAFSKVLYDRAHVEYDGRPDVSEIAASMAACTDAMVEDGDGDDAEDPAVSMQRNIVQSAEAVGDEGLTPNPAADDAPPDLPPANPTIMADLAPELDLLEVCKELGIADWRNIQLNPEGAPNMRLRPTQLIDGRASSLKAQNPLRTAMILSDCGTGKTATIGTALNCSINDQRDQMAAGTRVIPEGQPIYKPTWDGLFRIYSCYQTKATCTDPARKEATLDNLAQTQALFDELLANHEDIATARTIIMIPIHTFIRRFVVTEGELVGRPNRTRLNPEAGAMSDPEDEAAALQLEADNDISRDELSEDQAVEVKKLLLKCQVGRIVLDEAHFAKNPKSTLNQMIRMIPHDERYLASATILSNSVRDFFGYIELMWRPELPFAYDPATRTTPPSTFYDVSTWKQLVQGIDTEPIDAERIYRRTTDAALHVEPTDPASIAAADEYRRHIEATNEPLFLAHPRLYADYAAETQHSPAFAQNAIGTLLSMIGDVAASTKAQLSKLHAHLNVCAPREKGHRSRTGNNIQGPAVQVNPNTHRRMALISTNPDNAMITSPFKRTTRLMANRNVKSIMTATVKPSKPTRTTRKPKPLLGPRINDHSKALSPMQKKSMEAEARRQRPEASAGTAEMNRVQMDDPTKGLQWSFFITRKSLREAFPTEPISQ
ncbi:hypothetical protein FNAPI_663, partial [Fusarium napiforme]